MEALANAATHSGAKTATVVLAGAGGKIHLSVSDDGMGFDAASVRPGLGLISMRERARLAGGTLRIAAEPGEGARIEVSVPLPKPE